MKRQICAGLLVSFGLHAAVLGLWRVHSGPQRPQPSAAQERLMEVQLLLKPPGAAAAPQKALPASPALPAPPATAAAPQPDAASRVDGARTPDPAPSASAPAEDGAGLPALPLPYIPSKELDLPPQPESPVVVPFPDAPLDKPRVSAILVLFIGENGQVDRIEVGESDLPPVFEQAAIASFMQARMQPGMKDGKASRARMKILVEFEAR